MKKSEPVSMLSPTQEKFLAALLVHSTIKEAAAEVKITKRTAQNYLATPVFTKAYAEARKALIEETRNGLTALVALSLQGLEAILRDETAPANTRLKAIEMVFARVLDAPLVMEGPAAGDMIVNRDDLESMTEEEKVILHDLFEKAYERKAKQHTA